MSFTKTTNVQFHWRRTVETVQARELDHSMCISSRFKTTSRKERWWHIAWPMMWFLISWQKAHKVASSMNLQRLLWAWNGLEWWGKFSTDEQIVHLHLKNSCFCIHAHALVFMKMSATKKERHKKTQLNSLLAQCNETERKRMMQFCEKDQQHRVYLIINLTMKMDNEAVKLVVLPFQATCMRSERSWMVDTHMMFRQ